MVTVGEDNWVVPRDAVMDACVSEVTDTVVAAKLAEL
jgi:hypothetical protein